MRAFFRVAALLIAISSTASAAESRGLLWLRERATFEWLAAAGGWRTALGNDPQSSGFQAVLGGTELTLGLEVGGPVAIVAQGRFVVGVAGSDKAIAIEGMGALAVELRVGDVTRLRLGPSGGQLRMANDRGTLVGGFLQASFGLFALGPKLSLSLAARFDVDALLGSSTLPVTTLSLGIGLGFRY